MKLFVEGDINLYYVQTLCLLFFPGAKFPPDEELTDTSDVLTLRMVTSDTGVTAYAELRSGGKIAKTERYEPYKAGITKVRSAKIASGIAVLSAGKELFDCVPPWGIMTGVRPAKIALPMIDSGMSVKQVGQALIREYFLTPKKAALLAAVAGREAEIIKRTPARSCSVYISIPFCPSRCAYCSFVSYSTKRLLSMVDDYLAKLYDDLDRIFASIKRHGFKVVTVYVGGGTPTVLSCEQIKTLLAKITSHVDPDTLAEFTYEAGRPDTVTEEKMAIIKAFGVTRVSVNPQTLNDMVLENIGRHHTVSDFYRAYETVRKIGIKHVNTDLIAGLPDESFASFSHSVDEILKLRPDNVTFHTFCVKKAADILKTGNQVYSRNGGDAVKSVDYSQVKAGLAGYVPYYIYRQKNTVGNFENVGYCLEGAEGLYNIYMMEEIHSVFAAGAGAVTKLVNEDRTHITRIAMPKYPYEYLNPEYYDKVVSERERAIEELVSK